MRVLSAVDIIHIHDTVIHSHELQGEAPDKSVEAVITRVLNRFEYGLILPDVFWLAACYAVFIARLPTLSTMPTSATRLRQWIPSLP